MIINFDLEKRGLDKKKMIRLGIHVGGVSRKKNPLMEKYMLKKRQIGREFYFFDINKTLSSLIKIQYFLEKKIINKEFQNKEFQILIFSSKKQTSDFLIETASSLEIPYVINKWKGGLLTNFDTIKFKLRELSILKKRIDHDDYSSEKEKKKILSSIKKMENIYGGISNLHQKPSALFVIGRKVDNALKEAKKARIPVISVCGISSNPYLSDYVIPGNDSNTKSILFFLDSFLKTIKLIKEDFTSTINNNQENLNMND